MQHKAQKILDALRENTNFRALSPLSHQGKLLYKGEKPLLNLATNDYLGIAQDPSLQGEFLAQHDPALTPFSSSSSRILSGNFEIFARLESLLSLLYAPKSALLFNSGYHANIGCIDSLHQLGGVLFVIDSAAHASIFDGIKISRARFLRFKHNHLEEVEKILQTHAHKYEHVILVSEGIFSMDGDFAPLVEFVRFKSLYKNLSIYLDEAHSLGVCGQEMLGLAKEFALLESIDFVVLAFGKAIGSVGGCVLCSPTFKQYFINKARSLIYSTMLPPINIAFTLYVFENLSKLKSRQKHLQKLCALLKSHLQDSGIHFLGRAQIFCIMTHDNQKTLELSQRLEERGFYAPAIRPPTVPSNQARIRISLHAGLDKEEITKIAQALCK